MGIANPASACRLGEHDAPTRLGFCIHADGGGKDDMVKGSRNDETIPTRATILVAPAYISRTEHPGFLVFCLVVSIVWSLFHFLVSDGPVSAQDPQDTRSWHKYVRAPASRVIGPKQVLPEYTTGGVTNPNGLVDGSKPTVLTRSEDSGHVPTVVVDFGLNVVGVLSLDFAGAQNTTTGYPGLRLIFSESLEFLGNRSDFTRSEHGSGDTKLVDGYDQIAVKPDAYTWTDQWGCEFDRQVCADGLHGFRYVKIMMDALPRDSPYTSSYGSINISSISLTLSGFLGTPDTFTGWFECSDVNLTQWWYDGAYTAEMCTDMFRANDTELRDAISPSLVGKLVLHDGAKRDRDPYMGDLAVASLTSYLTHHVPEASSNVMEDLAQHQRSDGWIPPASINNYTLPLFDYPLWWVSSSWEHVFYTGNVSYIKAYYSTLLSVLDDYYTAHTDNTTSLLVRQDGYGDFAFTPRPGSAAYYSALYVLALNRAADLADLLSKSSDASRWRQRAETVSKSFVDELWDPTANAFFDRKCSGSGCNAHAQDGNSLAILSGIANSTQAKSALTYLATALYHDYGNSFYDVFGDGIVAGYSDLVYPFISYFETAARFAAGEVDSAFDQIRRMYGWMASNDPGVTMWEGIGAGGKLYEDGFTSLAHAWSTGIVPLMTNYVLGVTPTKPGFATWSIKPHSGHLTWTRGEVPTPRGPLKTGWEKEENGFAVWVEAPAGTSGTISIPVGKSGANRELSVNEHVVWDTRQGTIKGGAVLVDGFVRVDVEGGARHVVDYRVSTTLV